jgi:hypothetical protein
MNGSGVDPGVTVVAAGSSHSVALLGKRVLQTVLVKSYQNQPSSPSRPLQIVML